jgi:hypothetical protein
MPQKHYWEPSASKTQESKTNVQYKGLGADGSTDAESHVQRTRTHAWCPSNVLARKVVNDSEFHWVRPN